VREPGGPRPPGRLRHDLPVEPQRLPVELELELEVGAPGRLHIGFTHLGWNVWTGNQADLAATVRRLAEILERGPLPQFSS
jgi:hypothetical protein